MLLLWATFASIQDWDCVMATIHFTETTTATPEQFVANSSDQYMKVHEKGPTSADVTEGSNGIWERLKYDWSDPHRVVMTTIDSNIWGGHSGHTYTFTPQPDGTTQLTVDVVREGKNFKGRALGLLVGSVGKGVLRKALKNTIKAVEARNSGSAGVAS